MLLDQAIRKCCVDRLSWHDLPGFAIRRTLGSFSNNLRNRRNICTQSGVSFRYAKALENSFACFRPHSFQHCELPYEKQRAPSRYFYWSLIQLDSDPLSKRSQGATPCDEAKVNCVNWDLSVADRWDRPELQERILVLSALPAFLVGAFAVDVLGRLGISQVSSFMFLMPVLIFAWYYVVGWLLDGWIRGRGQPRVPTPD